MATLTRPSGVRVSMPDTYAVTDRPPTRGARSGARTPPPEPSPFESELISALGEFDLSHVDTIPFAPRRRTPSDSVKRRSGSAAAIPTRQEIVVEHTLAPGEQAVALVEQDGVYAWTFGEVTEEPDVSPRSRRRGGAGSGSRTVRFTITVHASSAKGRRTRGIGHDIVFRPIKAIVFKFAAAVAVGQLVKRLEAKLETGLVHIASDDATTWTHLDDPAQLKLPRDAPARVLLLLHGTFSSTLGGFGSLAGTQWGRDFLAQAVVAYDAVLGFDHRTLSDDPLDNAADILAALRRLDTNHQLQIDAVTHSRGGLVYRSLVELLAPTSGLNATFGRAVFVGAPNGGTSLAHSENWSQFVDLYTNLAVGSLRVLSAVASPTAPIASMLAGLLRGIATFVKAAAVTSLDDKRVPGLAAMDPDGEFIANINLTQPGQPGPGAVDYYAILSDFRAHLGGSGELPAKLLQLLADGLVDRIIGASNDLVVNTAAVTAIDLSVGGFVTDLLDLGENGTVYHTNYFHQQVVVSALLGWLNLDVSPAGLLKGHSDVKPGSIVGGRTAPKVNTDFVVLDVDTSAHAARRSLARSTPEFAIVRRADRGEPVYHYALRTTELHSGLEGSVKVRDAYAFQEKTSSPEAEASNLGSLVFPRRRAGAPSLGRGIAMMRGEPVGVVPSQDEMFLKVASVPTAAPKSQRRRATPKPVKKQSATAALRRAGRRAAASGQLEEPVKARHYFRAEMDREVVLLKKCVITVTISREQLAIVRKQAEGAVGKAEVDLTRNLILQIVPRRNFELAGGPGTPEADLSEGIVELEPIQPGAAEIERSFAVRPTNLGPGRVDVVVHQGQAPLVTLSLKPNIVRKLGSGPTGLEVAEAAVRDAPVPDGPLHKLNIYEVKNGSKVTLLFTFYSEQLDVRASETTQPLGARTIEDYVAKRYAEIERYYATDRKDGAAFIRHLQAVGTRLFSDLIPQSIRELLWKHRASIATIQVTSTEPYVPWELVHLKGPDRADRADGLFLGQLGLVRWMDNLKRGNPPAKIYSDRTATIIPEYPAHTDWELSTPAEERDLVEQLFPGSFRVDPDVTDVMDLLEKPDGFDLLHYAGHGAADPEDATNARLILEVIDQDDEWVERSLEVVDVEESANIAADVGRQPVVVLNACQVGRLSRRHAGIGGFATAFLTAGAGAFVSSLWAVGDEPAGTFVESFYRSLLAGHTLAEATTAAREAARVAGDTTWLAYTVYGNPYARLVKAPAPTRPATRKPATRKPAGKKPATRKPAGKRQAAKKTAGKKPTSKQSA